MKGNVETLKTSKIEILNDSFFNRDPRLVARELLGKVIFRKYEGIWLRVQIIETEAYLLEDKASHASLGYTEKRKALFMEAGTIYMYYSRGGDSMNVSCKGKGNAVLIKSGVLFPFDKPDLQQIAIMQKLNPINGRLRPVERLCSGQTLLCKSLHLKVKEWDQKNFTKETLVIGDVDYTPAKIVQTKRLGISKGRDEDLLYRYVDAKFSAYCTKPFSG
jgi:DNA-3-methyladenine glycosylase